jgi:YesN/AraC family two-component response regulator
VATVLAVDDDHGVLRSILRLLADAQHEVRSASSGEEAISALESNRFDLVVLDMKLPGISGADVLELIRANWPGTGVVCVTAYGTIRGAVRSLQYGAIDYVEKPFDNNEFLLVVDRAIRVGRYRADRVQRANKLETEYGNPAIVPADNLTIGDLPPGEETLASLVSFLATGITESNPAPRPELKRYQLLAVLTKGLNEPLNSTPPVFWSLARALRIVASPSTRDFNRAAEEIHQTLRNAVDVVINVRPKTRAVTVHLETKMVSTSGHFTLQQFCQDFGLTRNYLSRLLKVDTGLTFRQWRWAILLRAAARQLATSEDHVRQIAFAIGYEHASQFDRDFSRVFGMSPIQFRQLAQHA